MTKKKVRKIPRSNSDKFIVKDAIQSIQEALKSPVLNGGFTTLMNKIEQIEKNQGLTNETQGSLVRKIESIHLAIYHPDDGIFSRIKSLEGTVTAHNIETQTWRKSVEKELDSDRTSDLTFHDKINLSDKEIISLKHSIEQIEKSKKTVVSVIRWTSAVVFGGALSLAIKSLWTLIGW